MNHQVTSLTSTFKTVDAFGIKYATDFLPASLGGQQFALVPAAVPLTATLGAAQVSGADADAQRRPVQGRRTISSAR